MDHGKCLTPDQYVLLNGELVTGYEILARLKTEGILLREVGGGSTYQLKASKVLTLNDSLMPVEADSMVYTQRYVGPVYCIKTKTGRTVRVTPEHPLLVNREGRVAWVRARELNSNDHVAFARMIPLGEEPQFPDPNDSLRESYELVTWQDSERISRVTDGFTNFAAATAQDFEKLRLMAGLSKSELARRAHMNRKDLSDFLSGAGQRPRALQRLAKLFERIKTRKVSPDELILATRRGPAGMISRLIEPTFDDDLVKWFAFVFAEGHVREGRVGVTQRIQLRMLREFLKITKRKFGLEFKKVSPIDYHLNSKALVDFLRQRFLLQTGPKRRANLPSWLLRIPQAQKALFLRWFFTLDGEFNEQAGKISLTQVNHKTIVAFGYMLASFGIVGRFGTKAVRTKRGVVEYHRLSLSGRGDLGTFAEIIGFEDAILQRKLQTYLSAIAPNSKETNLSIPVDRKALKELLEAIGATREAFRPDPALPTMKGSDWYKAFEGARLQGRISRRKLLGVLGFAEEHLQKLESSRYTMGLTTHELLHRMSSVRLSQEEMAALLGTTPKVLARLLREKDPVTLRRAAAVVSSRIGEIVANATPVLSGIKKLANAQLEYDRVTSIETKEYDGEIFDLSVPGHENFLGGVGGIVCHNTTLTQAITGVWASAHSEELKRGITIKVGYADAAFYKCAHTPAPAAYSTSPKCPVCGKETRFLRAVSFVDCPGHESLMTNMLAGAFLMDGALLVIAANEPVPKPQTREHLQALQMLGMKKIVIAQNKLDLVTDAEAKKNHEQIEKFVANTVAADAPIIPISAQQKLNIDALIEALESAVPTPKRDASADALMYVVRSFDVNRPGNEIAGLAGGVLGGSLVRGELKVGEEVELRPGMIDDRSGKYVPVVTKVSSLQTGAGEAQRVGPGGLIAVGTHLDPSFTKGDQMVGSVIGKPGTLPPTWEHITLDLNLFETAVGSAELVKVDKVRPGENLRLNLGTASSQAVVTSARGDVIEVDLKKPVTVEAGMRAAVSRRIAERWRLIGSGVLK